MKINSTNRVPMPATKYVHASKKQSKTASRMRARLTMYQNPIFTYKTTSNVSPNSKMASNPQPYIFSGLLSPDSSVQAAGNGAS